MKHDFRWRADVTYHGKSTDVTVTHDIEELEELQGLVERGPDWNTILKIEITLARITKPGITLEKAAKQ